MAKIHGAVYLITGAFIFFFSYFAKKGFSLFIYVGLLMMIVGLVRLFKKKPLPHHKQTLHCPRCRAALRASDNFCHNCGNRIR